MGERLVKLREGDGWVYTPARVSAGAAGHLGSRGPKVAHATREDALRHAEEVTKKIRVPMHAYRCAFCEMFHVGTTRHAKGQLRDDALHAELGERVVGCIKRENLGKAPDRWHRLAAMSDTLERVYRRDHGEAI